MTGGEENRRLNCLMRQIKTDKETGRIKKRLALNGVRCEHCQVKFHSRCKKKRKSGGQGRQTADEENECQASVSVRAVCGWE